MQLIVSSIGMVEGDPELIAIQLAPPLVLLKIPAQNVPAYTVPALRGSIASARTFPAGGPPPWKRLAVDGLTVLVIVA